MSAAERVDTESHDELPVDRSDELRGSGQMRRISLAPTGAPEPWSEELPDLHPGDLVAGRYVIERPIGSGGHGAIHRALHRDLDLPVAIKVLRVSPHALGAGEIVARFQREARIAARIRHRNVLSVHDTGRLPDGSPYLVMELIDGEDLERRIARGALSIEAIVDLGRQLFAGLTAIAEAGVLHRDVKPANVMLHRETDGQVLLKLVDFGIARTHREVERLTVTGAIVGTPHYMCPEQLRGEEIDLRADLYAASAVLYEALTGRPPFDGEATALVIGAILSAPLVPVRSLRPDCPEALAQIVERGLSRKRSARPSHPMEVVATLDAIVRHEGLASGALAWAGDASMSHTLPIGLVSRRAHTPPDLPEAPKEPSPMPGGEPLPPVVEPEHPGQIEDPPPSIPPREAHRPRAWAAAGAVALTLVLAATWTMRAPADARERATPEATAALVAAPGLVDAPPSSGPTVDAMLDQGLEALARGEVDAALAHYRASVVADPSRAEAQRGRGLAAARAGLDDEAIAAFERYLAMAPGAPDAERVHDRLDALRARRSARLSPAPETTPASHGHRARH